MESINLFLCCAFLLCFVPANTKPPTDDEWHGKTQHDKNFCKTLNHTCFLSFMKSYCPNTCTKETTCCSMLKTMCHIRKVMELCPVTCHFNPDGENKVLDSNGKTGFPVRPPLG